MPKLHDEAMWYVLQLIKNNITNDLENVPYCIYSFMERNDDGSPTRGQQLGVLQKLHELGIVVFDESKQRSEIYAGAEPLTMHIYDLRVKDIGSFNMLYQRHLELEQLRVAQRPITLLYDCHTGLGLVKGSQQINLGRKNKLVFDCLYANANKWVERAVILKAVRYNQGADTKQAALELNTLIGNLRKATKLTPQHIVMRDGHAMLKATIIQEG
jgi:hypothetical protein